MSDKNLSEFSRLQLAQLGREYMLCAQFNSRTGYAALRINHGDEACKDVAIANWMGAGPVYTRRMQKAMGFAGGSDVATIFKGLQLECGFTHQYFDVHFAVTAADSGRFWLNSCGALLETEPRGADAVKVMCHDIEDPTFNATAVATNARARMTPVHRPPRVPADRAPHCEWTVFIDPAAEEILEPEITKVMSSTRLASIGITRPQGLSQAALDGLLRSAVRTVPAGATVPCGAGGGVQGAGGAGAPVDWWSYVFGRAARRCCGARCRRIPDDWQQLGDEQSVERLAGVQGYRH
ncbi:MAG: hypothetical protein IPG06_22375 [Haliea sp.]|nr:hypothetical protein [Haliea sp.]